MRAVRSVLGDIALPAGPMLAHEHLQIDLLHNKGTDNVIGAAQEALVIDDLAATRAAHGIVAVADLSVPGSGRDAAALARISQASGVSVIAATGFYWEPVPAPARGASALALRDRMIDEIERGIEDSEVRAGVIKVGTAAAPDADAERLFTAAAGAQQATGAAIITHTSTPNQAAWQLDILQAAGANLARVLISHMHKAADLAALRAVAARGACFGFDQLGFKKGKSIDEIADLAAAVIEAGLAPHLILSADIARASRLRVHGGDGYATTCALFLPRLRARGVPAGVLDMLMGENPRRLFEFVRA
jgi:phosphotriesterase-related protein